MIKDISVRVCSIVTALMVPVASTTARMSPLSTEAVKYCGCCFPFWRNAAKMATATNAMMMMIQFRLFFTFQETL